MMTNKEKFMALVSEEPTNALEKNRARIKQRAFLRESQRIALKVLKKLDELGWSQRDLARELEVSPQQITKIVSGKENLTLETQVKLQRVLNIPILAAYYETLITDMEKRVLIIKQHLDRVAFVPEHVELHYRAGKVIKLTQPLPHITYPQLAVS